MGNQNKNTVTAHINLQELNPLKVLWISSWKHLFLQVIFTNKKGAQWEEQFDKGCVIFRDLQEKLPAHPIIHRIEDPSYILWIHTVDLNIKIGYFKFECIWSLCFLTRAPILMEPNFCGFFVCERNDLNFSAQPQVSSVSRLHQVVWSSHYFCSVR